MVAGFSLASLPACLLMCMYCMLRVLGLMQPLLLLLFCLLLLFTGHQGLGTGHRHTRGAGLAGPKDRAAQQLPCGQAVRHKDRYHHSACMLVLHRHIYAPNASLSLDIAHPPVQTKTCCEDILLSYANDRWEWRFHINIPWSEVDREQDLT